MDNQRELNAHAPTPGSPQEKELIHSDQSIQTMEKQKAILRHNPIVFKIKQLFVNTRLIFDNWRGIAFHPSQLEYTKNHLEDALALTHYLETNVIGKIVGLKTEIPYKPSFTDLIQFSQLVGKKNDPVEILERMKHIGIKYTVKNLSAFIGLLIRLAESPTSIEGLTLIAQNNVIKKLFFRQYGSKESELNIKNMHIADIIEWDFITDKNLLKQITLLNNDPDALALLQLKEAEPYNIGYDGKTILKKMIFLQKHKLVRDLLRAEKAELEMFYFPNTENSLHDFIRQLVSKSMELWEIDTNSYDPENIIKKITSISSSVLQPKELEIYKPIINAPRESAIILTLCKELGFSLYKSITNISLLKKEITKNRTLKDVPLYELFKSIFIQQTCLDFLYEGDIAHETLEKIKEKGWITIQTYNRLYTARRKFIGFESYAYRPKKGDHHPVINVTYYKDQIPEHIQRYDKNYELYEKKWKREKKIKIKHL